MRKRLILAFVLTALIACTWPFQTRYMTDIPLKYGWPFWAHEVGSYMAGPHTPSTSVDHWRWWALGVDIVVWFGVAWAVAMLVFRRRTTPKP